jgi:hypothetical protein
MRYLDDYFEFLEDVRMKIAHSALAEVVLTIVEDVFPENPEFAELLRLGAGKNGKWRSSWNVLPGEDCYRVYLTTGEGKCVLLGACKAWSTLLNMDHGLEWLGMSLIMVSKRRHGLTRLV